MDIKPFKVEEWMNEYETGAKYNIAETCVDSMSLDELFALTGEDKDEFWKTLSATRLTYGAIRGSEKLLDGISKLYRTVEKSDITLTHGAAGANYHVFLSLINSGDHVVSIMPTYQQLYSIPEALGADVDILPLRKKNRFLPDLDELRALVRKETKMICINNPNNPSGALIGNDMLREIAKIARECDAYLLSDEVYRNLTQKDIYSESVADIYEKGISVSSMSKAFSLAGIRIGWAVTKCPDARKSFLLHRDYNLISLGIFDDAVASSAIAHSDKILERSRKIVRENLEILDAWINKNEHFSYVKPEAGTTALVYYDFNIPSYEFCKRLYKESGAFVTPGECFGIEHAFRIGYGYSKDALIKGLKEIENFSKTL